MRALYETKNEELDRKVKELKNDSIDKKRPDFNEALKLALNFLGTPAETWKKPNRNLKIMIHKMIFQENPKYSLKTGFGTPKLSLLFSVKQHILGNNDHLVELGVESLHPLLAEARRWKEILIGEYRKYKLTQLSISH